VTVAGIGRVAVVGAGTIGASWAALFMAHGLDVAATDARPEAGTDLARTVDGFLPSLEAVSAGRRGRVGTLTFAPDLAACCESADFVQENIVEREAEKVAVLARIDAAVGPDVVIASSSSAISVTAMQRQCRHPERVVLGHPFHPAHLVPLVELAGGTATASWAIDRAEAFYTGLGKATIRLNREIYGHVANRLQAAIFREAVHLLHEGVATAEDIDKAVTEGPGLRWALNGPLCTYHLAGGERGMRGFMAQFAPMQQTLWTDLGRPILDDRLQAEVVDAVEAVLRGKTSHDLSRTRDRRLEALLRARAATA
jgi:carnitine 3-dehydrogenase